MHIILGLIAIGTAAYFLVIRARNAAEMTHELMDVADDIRAAARRFGFRRRLDLHPVETIEDARLALAGVASAFIALDDLPTSDTRQALTHSLARHLGMPKSEAQELSILAQWMVDQCGGATPAIPRLSKKQYQLSQAQDFQALMSVIKDVAPDALSPHQSDALTDIQRAFRLS